MMGDGAWGDLVQILVSKFRVGLAVWVWFGVWPRIMVWQIFNESVESKAIQSTSKYSTVRCWYPEVQYSENRNVFNLRVYDAALVSTTDHSNLVLPLAAISF